MRGWRDAAGAWGDRGVGSGVIQAGRAGKVGQWLNSGKRWMGVCCWGSRSLPGTGALGPHCLDYYYSGLSHTQRTYEYPFQALCACTVASYRTTGKERLLVHLAVLNQQPTASPISRRGWPPCHTPVCWLRQAAGTYRKARLCLQLQKKIVGAPPHGGCPNCRPIAPRVPRRGLACCPDILPGYCCASGGVPIAPGAGHYCPAIAPLIAPRCRAGGTPIAPQGGP